MSLTRQTKRLTFDGAQALLAAAIEAARKMGVPQCIAIVDDGCNLVAFARMDGARVLSIASARRKAMTAAATGKPTGEMPNELGSRLAQATDGNFVNLKGGLPIIIDGETVGGIGVGSGTGEQDREVAAAALAAFPEAVTFSFS